MLFSQEQIKYLVAVGAASDITSFSCDRFNEIKNRSHLIAYSEDEFGIVAALLRDKATKELYALPERNERLYGL